MLILLRTCFPSPCLGGARLAKTKQATAAGAAVAKGVATGLQAATSEIGTSLAQTVTCATGGSKGGAPGRPEGEGQAQAPVKPAMAAAAGLGGIGVELLRVRGELWGTRPASSSSTTTTKVTTSTSSSRHGWC